MGSLVHNDNKQRVTEEILFLREGRREVEAICPDFKHKNLAKLTIYGFQPDGNFMRYIRCIVEHAVNITEISLYDRRCVGAVMTWILRSRTMYVHQDIHLQLRSGSR